MSTLAEIENAAEKLSVEEKEKLLLFLATLLRSGRQQLPPPRRFTREQIGSWIAEDEADLERSRAGS
jgi:hypothetical protein